MKRLLAFSILFLLLFLGACDAFYQRDYILDKRVIKIDSTNIEVRYKLYQTGIDNYTYEFYGVADRDTTNLLKGYLNDATYKGFKLEALLVHDSIQINDKGRLVREDPVMYKGYTVAFKK